MHLSTIRTKPLLSVFLLILLGLAIRLLFLFTPTMDSDQAVNGLMARHILGGSFPQIYYGQDYCGSIEAYLTSSVFYLLGASRFTLDLSICLLSLFFVFLIYQMALKVINIKGALLSALFAAIPSYYLLAHSVLARAAYIEIPIIGTILLIIASDIICQNKYPRANYFLLGFFSGLAIWTQLLVIYYVAPIIIFIFIRDPFFWKRPIISYFFFGLLFGGLPLWAYNIYHPLATWYYLQNNSGETPVLPSLAIFFSNRFPEILGIKNNETGRFFMPLWSPAIYLLELILFVFLFYFRRREFLRLFKLKFSENPVLELLLLFFFLTPIIFSLSGFAGGGTSRYLTPLYSVLPILFAFFVIKIYDFSRLLSIFVLLLIIFSNLYGTLRVLPLIQPHRYEEYQSVRESEHNLFKFLKEKNLKHVYTPDYWISVRLTFDAQEEIIFALPSGDRYPIYSDLTDRDPRAAFLFQGDNKEFEETLINIGGTFRKSQVFGFSIYHDFSPPQFQFLELEPTKWKAISVFNSKDLVNIFDRDLSTRWSSGKPQEPGVALQIDLGQVMPDLGRITLFSGKVEDVPRSLRMEISRDGREWQTVRETSGLWGDLFWSGPHPFYRPGIGRIDITFSPRAGRFIKLTQTGSDPNHHWSVGEFFIYQSLPKIETPPEDLTSSIPYLKRFNIANINATPWLQSQFPLDWRAKQRAWAVKMGEEGLVHTISNPIFIVEKHNSSALSHFFNKILKRPYQKHEITGGVLYYFPPSSNRNRPISSTQWSFETNYNPKDAHWAADGRMSTRWTTERPQVPGAYFQINFGKMEKVGRIRLLTGTSFTDFPRGYSIRYSVDGQTWTSLDSIVSPVSLTWTGETLLKSGQALDLTFPSTPMRFLKIIETGQDNVFFWSIHEVEVYD